MENTQQKPTVILTLKCPTATMEFQSSNDQAVEYIANDFYFARTHDGITLRRGHIYCCEQVRCIQ